MSALSDLRKKLAKSKRYRESFAASVVKRMVPLQIRVLRKQREWSQSRLAEESKLTQGVISRAEDPNYGNLTVNTLMRIGAGFDCAFIGRFVPFSHLAGWYSNLEDENTLEVPSFDADTGFAKLEEPKVAAIPPRNIYTEALAGRYMPDEDLRVALANAPPVGLFGVNPLGLSSLEAIWNNTVYRDAYEKFVSDCASAASGPWFSGPDISFMQAEALKASAAPKVIDIRTRKVIMPTGQMPHPNPYLSALGGDLAPKPVAGSASFLQEMRQA